MNAANETPENEPLWTAEQTAKYLSMSLNWVYRRTESGEIPHAKLGRAIRYSPARVREYAAKLQAEASSPNVVSLAERRGGKRGR